MRSHRGHLKLAPCPQSHPSLIPLIHTAECKYLAAKGFKCARIFVQKRAELIRTCSYSTFAEALAVDPDPSNLSVKHVYIDSTCLKSYVNCSLALFGQPLLAHETSIRCCLRPRVSGEDRKHWPDSCPGMVASTSQKCNAAKCHILILPCCGNSGEHELVRSLGYRCIHPGSAIVCSTVLHCQH